MYAVSSSFKSLASAKNAQWARRLTIGGSDYTSKVMQWPSISRSWDSVVPSTVTINLSNADRTFNFFLDDGTKLHAACELSVGFASIGEYISLMAGTVDALRFGSEQCSMTVVDKFKQLTTKLVGNSTSAISYTSSSYLVHNLAWYVCTSHGGLSALTSTSNPDIDYASFNSWTSVFSADNVRIKAQFAGLQPAEILKRIATITQSAIWIESNRVKFARFTISDSSAIVLDDSVTIDASQVMDERDLINRFYVGAAYDVSSRTYAITVNDSSSSSISRYGLVERSANESAVWYVDSASALNFAQRMILTSKEILPQLQLSTPLNSLFVTIGDTIAISDSHLQITDNYRVMSEVIDVENGRKSFVADQTQYLQGFRLDVSSLDGTDVLT